MYYNLGKSCEKKSFLLKAYLIPRLGYSLIAFTDRVILNEVKDLLNPNAVGEKAIKDVSLSLNMTIRDVKRIFTYL